MKQKHRRKKILFIIIFFLLGSAIIVGLRFAGRKTVPQKRERIREEYQKQDDEEPKGRLVLNGMEYTYFHEFETYLFIGTDASGAEDEEREEYRGSMADFLLVAVIDRTAHTYALLQLNRDTMTDVTLRQTDGSGMASANLQLCTAHWYGGTKKQSCENTVEAVSKLLGNVPITGYYAVNMEQIQTINHAVGGVDVTVEDDFSRVDSSLKKGETLTLSDEQAYTFVHDRYGVDDETNLSRMERQKQYLSGLLAKSQKLGEDDPDFLLKMYQVMKKESVTDITGKKVSKLIKEISRSTNNGIYTLEGTSKTGKKLGDGIEHTEFYVKENSLLEIMTKLYGLRRI